MDPTIMKYLGQARQADMHRQAQRDALARALRQAQRSGQPTSHAARRPTVLTRWAQRLGLVSVS
jgi:hypothetical protein